jgi:ATP-binding cassette subfamily F protein uup
MNSQGATLGAATQSPPNCYARLIMAWITLNEVSLAYGHVPLLDRVAFALEAGERVGIVGRNGTGKSSLLKILAGLEKPDDGSIQFQTGVRRAHVTQEPVLDDACTIFETVSIGLAHVRQLCEQYLAHAPGTDLDALQNAIEALDGWRWEQRVAETLSRLDLEPTRRVGTLSGGLRKRVALAQALVALPDVLLLDEPTNHLDMDAIGWLADWLKGFGGAMVVISHDRDFLDRVTTRMVELDRGQLNSYAGNFSTYQRLKEDRLAQEAVVQAKADKLLAQEEAWIRKGVEARRTRAQARIERLGRLREQRAQRREVVGQVRMEVSRGDASGKLVAELEGVSKSFVGLGTTQTVVRRFSTTVLRGDKIGLIGPNGAGKTTLLKLILGQLAPDEGRVRTGSKLEIAYFDQMRDQLDLHATLEDFISPGSEWIEIGNRRTHVKSYLSDFLFSPARAQAPVSSLSGGERNRLLMARLFARPANVLVLDEPTNDLDIDTLELLEQLLADFDGTVFLVSHDRRFLDNVVTSTLVFEGEGHWCEYEGGVTDWLTQSTRLHGRAPVWGRSSDTPTAAEKIPKTAPPAASTPATNPTTNATTNAAPPRRKLSYKEQRELDAMPERIAQLEQEQQAIDQRLADGALYVTAPHEAAQLAQRHADIEDELMQALERWERLGAQP